MPLDLSRTSGFGTLSSGGSSADSFLVAASDAPDSIKNSANYTCDGVADEVQIMQALYDAQMYAAGTETFTGSDFTNTIFGGAIGTWGVSSNKAKVTSGENGSNICRLYAYVKTPDTIWNKNVINGFDYAVDLTYQAGTAGVYMHFANGGGSNTIDGVAFVVDGTNMKLLEGAGTSLSGATVRGTTAHAVSAGTTIRLSLAYEGQNRFVAKINGVAAFDTTITSPPHDYEIFYRQAAILTFHTTTSNNTFDNFAYAQAQAARPVHLSPGHFYLTKTIVTSGYGSTLLGAGSGLTLLDVIGLSSASYSLDMRGEFTTVFGLSIEGTRATANDVESFSAANTGGTIFQHQRSLLKECGFRGLTDTKAVAVDFIAGLDVIECRFDNLGTSTGCSNTSAGRFNTIDGCTFTGTGDGVLSQTAGLGVRQIRNSWFNASEGLAIFVQVNANTDSGPIVTGNRIESGQGIKFVNLFAGLISGNFIEGNWRDGGDSHGIHLYHSDQNTVTGNTIAFNRHHGILIEASVGNMVSGNLISENGETNSNDNVRLKTSSEATPRASDYNNIDGNTVRRSCPNDANSYYGNLPGYGINVTAGTANKITNNDIHQSGFVGDLLDSGTSTVTSGNRT